MGEIESPDIEKEVGKVIAKKRDEGKLIKLKLKDIVPYKNNAKIHTEKQVGQIRDSIMTFGYKDYIAVDENNLILEGHGRLRALYQIDTTGQMKVSVIQISDFTEAEKKAYRIAHNKLNLNTGFDLELLKDEFHQLEGSDNFNDTGFEVKEISEIWDAPRKDTTNVTEHERELHKEHKCPNCGHKFTESK